jgi:hypothetical protein
MGRTVRIACLLAAGLLAGAALAQQTGQRVDFAAGETQATVEGALSGFGTGTHVVAAGAGQTLAVTLTADNPQTAFNVYAPGTAPGEGAVLYNGARQGPAFEAKVPASGDYTIQVYLSRAAARRSEASSYSLEVALTGEAEPATEAPAQPSPEDALVPGTNFHAVGEIPCAVAPDQPMGACGFGVRRSAPGSGSGAVTVTLPDGNERLIRFEGGAATGSNGTGPFGASHEGDLTTVTVGDERYQIPDSVIWGG